jgi:hypothetical protein
MATPPPTPPLQPGQLVRRRYEPSLIGVVVGVILTPLQLALVRWGPDDTTIEPLEALVEVLKLFG